MARYIFKGKKVEIPGEGIKWVPTAQVRLISDQARYFCEMIVDSGADISLIPRSLGEFLQLKLDDGKIKELRSIGEAAIPYVTRKLKIQVGNTEFHVRIGITLIEETPFILGRLDVFDVFNIEFKQKKQETIFRTA